MTRKVSLSFFSSVISFVTYLAVFEVFGRVLESQQDTACRPGELVTEGVIGILGCRQTAAEGNEFQNLLIGRLACAPSKSLFLFFLTLPPSR